VGHGAQPREQRGSRRVRTASTVNLEINGVGYRAQADAKTLKLQLGYSHDVEVPIPAGIQIKALKPTEVKSPARIVRRSDSSRRRSAACVHPSPTRARASSIRPRRSVARKARRSKGESTMSDRNALFARRQRRTRYALRKAGGVRRASAFSARASNIYAQVID